MTPQAWPHFETLGLCEHVRGHRVDALMSDTHVLAGKFGNDDKISEFVAKESKRISVEFCSGE